MIQLCSWKALPKTPLASIKPITKQFQSLGCFDFFAAGKYLAELPYGRTSISADYRLVLREKIGACSSKHALLYALTKEENLKEIQAKEENLRHEKRNFLNNGLQILQDVPVKMMMGVYLNS